MMPDAKMSAEMMKAAKSIKHCTMTVTDAKGKPTRHHTRTEAGRLFACSPHLPGKRRSLCWNRAQGQSARSTHLDQSLVPRKFRLA
ncbi:hypothetical protein EN836_11595 [Mesorhizobium sp. M1C.F.Ca.ET.193.01.1.1]|nr:hypothetical protein EN853_11590 [Mesorhizobium sp. M1C.F.Ca.ET.210.01.1.1]TGQ72175.1 hypothetical protein EN855_011600 [Mesorhizobium sp. M1C.F.Ca.ET.212.01.1.1]TGR09991.1 hypothetical protein EN847_11595 [Mesorhizobium sp. M1C.F.Ca.ET.204.01.1.1]TGR30111.1 hypothetical protein EN839_11595 [Mesorhizobium sp. M1C.F.Ca.ET.196.01.1.1]TGR52639.1 hypothetical protein EN838_11600 [Mesorhizobium sp. M1C.F.Ca.ET.195.01.1.1]TGR66437.1 hypothetical protein EN835_011590 [Mesorhizobium sp. M1C.F.Ca.ET